MAGGKVSKGTWGSGQLAPGCALQVPRFAEGSSLSRYRFHRILRDVRTVDDADDLPVVRARHLFEMVSSTRQTSGKSAWMSTR